MAKKIVVLLLLLFAFNGCTRDDICPGGTATTPNLIIVFNNILNPDDLSFNNRKAVDNLSIETDYDNSVLVLSNTITDSIVLPLNTNSDTTKYRFIRTIGIDDAAQVNVDKVMFIYNRKEIYVNRACGYKMAFEGVEAVKEDEGSENWIRKITINRDTIIDEQKAHLTFFH